MNYIWQGVAVKELIEEIRRRIKWSIAQSHNKTIYANSDVANYREGYEDSLGELMEWIEDEL